MFDWNCQDQVGVLFRDKHKKNDHILKRPLNEVLLTFGEYSKKQRSEDAGTVTMSSIQTSGTKNDFFDCNVAKRSGNSSQDCNDSSLHMDAWSGLPYLRSVLNDGFNDGSDQDSAVTELMNDLADASNQYSGAGFMTRYNNSSELFPSKPCSLSMCDAMQLDGEPDWFGHDDKGNDSFSDCDWANIEDLNDLDKMFRNNDSFYGNEKVHNINSFHNTSSDITSNTSQSIPVPDVLTSMEQTSGTGSSYHQFGESSEANVNSLLIKKCLAWGAQEEEGNGISFQDLNYSYSSEKQRMSNSEVQGSYVNPLHIIHSPRLGQVNFSHGFMFSDYECPIQLPQLGAESNHNESINGGFEASLNHSNNQKISNKAEAAVPNGTIMASREKIEKLEERKKLQAMLEIQKQCEQYGHQICSTDDNISQECSSNNQTPDATTSADNMEEYKQKKSTPEISYMEEQCQPQVMSSLTSGCTMEVPIYHQLQYIVQKLDVRIRLNIRDSLFRLALSTMDRLKTSDISSTDKSKDEYEISMDEKLESNNHDRSYRMPDSERVTNPIDRIVAHLLFHSSSRSYLLPIGDGNVPRATSMRPW